MLKWTVMARRQDAANNVESTPSGRHSTANIRTQTKRRHSTGLTSQRRRNYNRISLNPLDLEANKENNFISSTPIKDQLKSSNVLRDLTPNNGGFDQKQKITTPSSNSHRKVKKKKKCINPILHERENYFQHFETVDSHIEGILDWSSKECGGCKNKRNIHQAFENVKMQTPLGKYFASQTQNADLHPNKKAKLQQVNHFLHQITFVTSPEEEDPRRFALMECKNNMMSGGKASTKVSPLVKQFLDLKFSKINNNNNSSSIDDLSLDKIVDAILDSSGENVANNENDVNETLEDNLINSQKVIKECTEMSHNLEGSNQTIIATDETFNERCVDEVIEKRAKKRSLEDNEEHFTLKRQKCIRRKIKNKTSETDESFNSSIISGKISDENKSTPVLISSNVDHHTSSSNSRFRRCLLFDDLSTSSSSSSSSSSIHCNDKCQVGGVMDLNIYSKDNQLFVNVIRCKELIKTNGGSQINAYVKVYLGDSHQNKNTLQRTSVHANSTRPFFNHTFKFELNNFDKQRIQIEVWHRDRITRTSEFLGCMSFDVKDVCQTDITTGSYRLLPQPIGRHQNVPTITAPTDAMCETHSNNSIDEMMSLDDAEFVQELKKSSAPKSVLINEQQKQADENLFLRYLELDPVEGPEAIPAATQRKATGNKNGRTPFTTTKKLMRQPKSGFGFSVVWTHPPRIERVEKGLPADKAGILPGDYLIFVDKHNVVMMPEIEILNLIRSYGSQLTLEIFRRNAARNGSVPSIKRLNNAAAITSSNTSVATTTTAPPPAFTLQQPPPPPCPFFLQQQQEPRRPSSTVCSTNATSIVDYNTTTTTNRKKLHLPQVTFSAEKSNSSNLNQDESRKKLTFQIIHKEQHYATALQFAISRFVSALAERKDLITPSEHKVLFQNIEEILRVTEDIIDLIMLELNEGDSHYHIILHAYYAKLNDITTAYKRYCIGIKKADCVLANKTRNSNSEFSKFLTSPSIPKRRPDITTFIHKPLEHFRDILKLLTMLQATIMKSNQQEYAAVINQIVNEMQSTYRQITVDAGLMEPMGEGRPLLSVQDLENRLVFTKCKPFVLNKPGRQWIFGGDLGRVEGRQIRQYWTLLFSDLLLFAKVSRDRVLFIIEDPIPLNHVTDMFFNVRKKDTEFRLTINPDGCHASSPTVHCGPDLSKTPKKGASKKVMSLRAPTAELKAVWQNLLQRQIFQINANIDGTNSSFSSPIESPCDVAPITSSVVTLQSAESFSYRQRHHHQTSNHHHPHESNEHQQDNLAMMQKKQIDALIEHKCKQLSKTNSTNAIHLEQWMKGQLQSDVHQDYFEANDDSINGNDLEPLSEEWTEEMLRKRSEELQLIDKQGNITINCFQKCDTMKKNINKEQQQNNKFDDLSDHSPSKSTTTESQVTVRSSPLVPETVPVCRQCHKNCLQPTNNNNNNNTNKNLNKNRDEDDWRPLLLMGLSAINPAAHLVKLDPFGDVPEINVVTPSESHNNKSNCCDLQKPSPDDSPQTEEEHPYHSLSSSNLTLRRFGTVSSLEKLADELNNEEEESDESEGNNQENGIDNEAFYQHSIRTWTAKAGLFMAEKMAFFGGLMHGDELAQEEETSGATSGEEIWGTPTSGGELDDPLSSPNYEGKHSPYDGSVSSGDNGDDTELMMDELLMTPPISGAIMRGLLPRRTLEPLIEEDVSESTTTPSTSPSDGNTPTEPSLSPEQGNGIGDVADTCLTAVDQAKSQQQSNLNVKLKGVVWAAQAANSVLKEMVEYDSVEEEGQTAIEEETGPVRIPRSESYRRIVEAAEDEYCLDRHHQQVLAVDGTMAFFNRFKTTPVKFINIERVPRTKSVKIFEFFNMRRERRIHQTLDQEAIKMFDNTDQITENNTTSHLMSSDKPFSPAPLKDKQMDRRFWKQLSKRRHAGGGGGGSGSGSSNNSLNKMSPSNSSSA